MQEDVGEVEKIISRRVFSGKVLYLTKWRGYSVEEATWESVKVLKDVKHLVKDFMEKNKIQGVREDQEDYEEIMELNQIFQKKIKKEEKPKSDQPKRKRGRPRGSGKGKRIVRCVNQQERINERQPSLENNELQINMQQVLPINMQQSFDEQQMRVQIAKQNELYFDEQKFMQDAITKNEQKQLKKTKMTIDLVQNDKQLSMDATQNQQIKKGQQTQIISLNASKGSVAILNTSVHTQQTENDNKSISDLTQAQTISNKPLQHKVTDENQQLLLIKRINYLQKNQNNELEYLVQTQTGQLRRCLGKQLIDKYPRELVSYLQNYLKNHIKK